jgi:hypothetical protein
MKPTVSRPQAYATCATIDTSPQSLYTRADVPVSIGVVSERRFHESLTG